MKKIITLIMVLSFAVVLVSCKPKETVDYVLTLTGSQSVKAGETITLIATTDKEDAVYVWTSSDPAVATVANGVVTGVKDGTTVISVSVKGVGEKFLIVNVSEFTFSLIGDESVKVSRTTTLNATTDKPSPAFTWTSSDPTVATVVDGVVTGVKEGTAVITVALAGVGSLTKTVKVMPKTTVTIGNTTEAGVNMFGTFWGNNATNNDIRNLTFGYSTVSFRKTGKYELDPQVVKNFAETENADGSKTYEMEIFDDLLWNDGEKITAKDYVFSLLLSINPVMSEVVGKTLTTTGDIVGSEDYAKKANNADGLAELAGVDLIDDYTFSVTINADRFPYYYEFLYYSVTPYPLHKLAPNADIVQGTSGAKIAGTFNKTELTKTVDNGTTGYRYDISVTSGPYSLYDFDASTSTATLVANPLYKGNYEGQTANIDTVVITYVTTATQMQALLNGEIDLIPSVSGGDAIISGLEEVAYGKINFSKFSRNGFGLISFHADEAAGPTSSVAVRQSLAYLLNRTLFAETYTRGYGVLPHGQYGLSQWMVQAASDESGNVLGRDKDGNEVQLEEYSYNPVKAAQLLDADGWNKNATGGAYVQGPGTVRYKQVGDKLVKLEVPWANTTGNPVSDLIRSQLLPNAAAIGFAIKDQAMDFNTLLYTHYYGADGDGYLLPEQDEDGNWLVPEYQKKDGDGNIIEPDKREYHMVNLGTGFNPGIFEPYYDVSIEYWGWDGGANVNYLYDAEMLDAAERMMRAGNDDDYLYAWQQFQLRYNKLLPAIPLYSDIYHAFFSTKLVDYDTNAEWTVTEAILYANMK